MGCCDRCPCCPREDEVLYDYSVDMVEDGDVLQDFGVNRTLELLRRMMDQAGRVVVDQPPPAYADFDKYPLASEEELKSKDSTLSVVELSTPGNRIPQVTTEAPPGVLRCPMWTEPYPKPTGEPPPLPQNWFRTRLASIRRSILARFSGRGDRRTSAGQAAEVSVIEASSSLPGQGRRSPPHCTQNDESSDLPVPSNLVAPPQTITLAQIVAGRAAEQNETSADRNPSWQLSHSLEELTNCEPVTGPTSSTRRLSR
ncbi:unnamed protein product [Calicophoron daubneyi]|uniref:Uncharacterized protein n=1 Tax=Calicophoron daubneyi TaxID=300641 RepID=A0AAV2TXU9_CALDB